MNMPEGQTLTGQEAPAWMATKESIDAAAQVYREKVPAYMERSHGHCVLGSFYQGALLAVEDRSTGVIFRRFEVKQEIGSTVKTNWECIVNGQANQVWPHHVQILRRVEISEVRKIAKFGVGLKPENGLWYEVHSD